MVPHPRPAPPAGARRGAGRRPTGRWRGGAWSTASGGPRCRSTARRWRSPRPAVRELVPDRPHGCRGARHPGARRPAAEHDARRGRAGLARGAAPRGCAPRSTAVTTCCARPCSTCGPCRWGCRSAWRAGATGGATRGRVTCRSWRPRWPAPGTPSTRPSSWPSCRRCSATTGWFEARYDLRTRRTPDERVAQLDGSAWVGVGRAPARGWPRPTGPWSCSTPLRPMLVRSAQRLIASLDAGTRLPMASSDYWELVERSVTLGTAASVLAGLRSATEVLPLVGEPALAERTPGGGRVAGRRRCTASSAPRGYPRMLDDSAPTPRSPSSPHRSAAAGADDGVLTAMGRAQAAMARPAGGRGARGRVEGRRHQLDPRDGAVRRRLGRERRSATGPRPCSAGSATTAPTPGRSPRRCSSTGARPPWRRSRGPRRWSSSRGTSWCTREAMGGAGGARRRSACSACSAGRPLAGASAADGAAAADARSPRLVVVGAPGLSWSDLDGGDLPALDALASEGALGSLTVRAVRSRACAVDGWLTLSAGRRAADVAGPCREPLPVVDGAVPRWAEYLAAAAAGSYDAHPGTLGDGVTASGACVETRRAGRRDRGRRAAAGVVTHLPAPTCRRRSAARWCSSTAARCPSRGRRARRPCERLDALVAQVRAADPGADVVVAGVGDGASPVRPRAIVAAGPSYARGLLTSASTRQPGVVQLQDLTATALTRVGASEAEVTGRPLTVSPRPPVGGGAGRRAGRVRDPGRDAAGAQPAGDRAGWPVALRRCGRSSSPCCGGGAGRAAGCRAARGFARRGGVAVAAAPVSTFVVNLVPWWRAGAPAVVFLGGLAVVVGPAHRGGAVGRARADRSGRCGWSPW